MKKLIWPLIILILFVGCSPQSSTESSAHDEDASTSEIEVIDTQTEEMESEDSTEDTIVEVAENEEAVEVIEEEMIEETIVEELTQEEKDDALLTAVRDDDLASAKSMIAQGADLNVSEPAIGFTPIAISIIRENQEMFNILFEAGADITTIDKQENTLLHHAAMSNQHEIAEILLSKESIDLEHRRDQFGFTPLLTAAFEGHVEMVELLIAHGANIEAEDNWKDTPINVAAWNGQLAVVETLIALGANPDAQNTSGNNALDHAKNQNHEEVETFLASILSNE